MIKQKMTWIVYILCCKDGTFYCGCTTNIDRRIKQHNNGTGAKYTRSRSPVKLVYSKKISTKSDALKLEHKIKCLSRLEKIRLINFKIEI
jgi:putative endonuclease